jgi:hypothetical protein
MLTKIIPNAAAEPLALLLRMLEVPGSNVGPETGFHNRGLSWGFSVIRDKC